MCTNCRLARLPDSRLGAQRAEAGGSCRLERDPPTLSTFHPLRARGALQLHLSGRRLRPRCLLGVVVPAPPRSPASSLPLPFLAARPASRYPQTPAAAGRARPPGRRGGRRKRAALRLPRTCQPPLEGDRASLSQEPAGLLVTAAAVTGSAGPRRWTAEAGCPGPSRRCLARSDGEPVGKSVKPVGVWVWGPSAGGDRGARGRSPRGDAGASSPARWEAAGTGVTPALPPPGSCGPLGPGSVDRSRPRWGSGRYGRLPGSE